MVKGSLNQLHYYYLPSPQKTAKRIAGKLQRRRLKEKITLKSGL